MCGSAASTGLCGGQRVIAVPTATTHLQEFSSTHHAGDNRLPRNCLRAYLGLPNEDATSSHRKTKKFFPLLFIATIMP